MPPFAGCVSLTTDYGLSDGFVAACHGVLLRRAPGVPIVDVTHLVPAGDVRRGALVLAQTVPHLPRGVHVGVVDPGVGTRRRALALRAPGGHLVGPDNGLLVPAAEALGGVADAVDLTVTPGTPATFHGRDVFTPAAAALATGARLSDLGAPVLPDDLVRLPAPVARVVPASGRRSADTRSDALDVADIGDVADGRATLEAEVAGVDGFGNVQFAAPAAMLTVAGLLPGVRVRATQVQAGSPVPGSDTGAGAAFWSFDLVVGVTFGSVAPGELVLYADSAGMAALAERDGDAATRLGLRPGDLVRLTPVPGYAHTP